MSTIKKGDRVIWCYLHHLNSKSTTLVNKHGTYIAKKKHTARYTGLQMAYVHFDGNKRYSSVPLCELELEKEWKNE